MHSPAGSPTGVWVSYEQWPRYGSQRTLITCQLLRRSSLSWLGSRESSTRGCSTFCRLPSLYPVARSFEFMAISEVWRSLRTAGTPQASLNDAPPRGSLGSFRNRAEGDLLPSRVLLVRRLTLYVIFVRCQTVLPKGSSSFLSPCSTNDPPREFIVAPGETCPGVPTLSEVQTVLATVWQFRRLLGRGPTRTRRGHAEFTLSSLARLL